MNPFGLLISPAQRDIAISVLLQALGAASTLGVAFLISLFYGLEVQGQFGLLKGWTDILVVVLLAGLPQSVLHLVYRHGLDAGLIHHWIQRYCLLLLTIAALIALVLRFWTGHSDWSLVVIAAPALVYHGLVRLLLLRPAGIVTYAWITILPAIALVFYVGLLGMMSSLSIAWAISAAGFSCAAIASLLVIQHGLGTGSSKERIPQIGKMNTHAFIFNVCAAAQVGVILLLFTGFRVAPGELGAISFAFYFQQAFAVVAGFLAPSVYDRYARAAVISEALRRDRGRLLRFTVLVIMVEVTALACIPLFISSLFPESYHRTSDAAVWMAASGILLLFNRFFLTVLQAAGSFSEMGMQGAARLILDVMFAALIYRITGAAAEAVGISLFIVEALLLLRVAFVFAREPRKTTLSDW